MKTALQGGSCLHTLHRDRAGVGSGLTGQHGLAAAGWGPLTAWSKRQLRPEWMALFSGLRRQFSPPRGASDGSVSTTRHEESSQIVTKVKGRQGRTAGSTEADSKARTVPLPTPVPAESLLGVHLRVLAGTACRGFSIHILVNVVLLSVL